MDTSLYVCVFILGRCVCVLNMDAWSMCSGVRSPCVNELRACDLFFVCGPPGSAPCGCMAAKMGGRRHLA